MSITLSDSAAARVNTFLANRGKGFGLRLGVRTSGCSGMAYVLEFVDEPTPEDIVFEDKGVKPHRGRLRVGFVLPDSPLSRRIAALRMLWITSPSLACLPVINSIPRR